MVSGSISIGLRKGIFARTEIAIFGNTKYGRLYVASDHPLAVKAIFADIIELSAKLTQAESVGDAVALFGTALSSFSLDYILVWRRVSGSVDLTGQILASTFPEAWLSLYSEKQYWRYDPALAGMLRTGRITRWRNRQIYNESADVKANSVLESAARFGLVDGMVVPVFGIGGYMGAVSVAGTRSIPDEPWIDIAIQSLAIPLFQRIWDLRKITPDVVYSDEMRLTRRELDCLRWVAKGKSDWEISQILEISESTVHFHIENAKRKFNSQSRIQVVVRAFLLGLIGL